MFYLADDGKRVYTLKVRKQAQAMRGSSVSVFMEEGKGGTNTHDMKRMGMAEVHGWSKDWLTPPLVVDRPCQEAGVCPLVLRVIPCTCGGTPGVFFSSI